MPDKRRSNRSIVALMASGVITSACASWFCSDVAFQSFIARPAGTFLAVITALFVWLSLLGAENQRLRVPLLVAVSAAVTVDLILLTLTVRWRWLSGVAFSAALRHAALIYGPAVAWYVAVPLIIYGRLAAVSKYWAFVAYASFVLGFSAVSVLVVRRLLVNGTFVFAGGYSIVWDCVWGVGQYALALLVYRQLTQSRWP